MSLASPATSTATNRTNRGGRPKEWTEPRTRRLGRLYLYTSLPIDKILDLLRDEVWNPGKEAANKHLHHFLGKDPRWLRPKNENEQRKRIAGLKKSERAKKQHKCGSSPTKAGPDSNSLFGFSRADTLDGTTLARSSGSSFEKGEFHAQNTSVPVCPDVNYMNPNASQTSLLRFVPKIISRQGTTSTDFSVGSTQEEFRSVQGKLEGYSKPDIKDIFRVLKRFTISNESDPEQSTLSPLSPNHRHGQLLGHFDQLSPEYDVSTSGYVIPGDFLQQTELQQRLRFAAQSSSPQQDIQLDQRDRFGNTAYHLLAATEGCQKMLLQSIEKGIVNEHLPMSAKNTGGQTFLHVLHPSWYDEGSSLEALVVRLRFSTFDFYATDVYGRSFIHILRQNLDIYGTRMGEITQYFNVNIFNRRDAFGNKPMMLRQAGTMPPVREESQPRLTIPSGNSNDAYIERHTQLLKVITDSSKQPAEDKHGRNGLHCLAEVRIDTSKLSESTIKTTKSQKRKMDSNDEPTLLDCCPLSRRLEYLQLLLEAKVDVNHYDNNGNTPLMAFLTHIPDGQEDKDLEKIICSLISAGANLEARNRNGETAVHIAVRFGQKFALKVLVEQGANPHVRNHDGLGLLRLNDRLHATTEDDNSLNIRLDACRNILTTERHVRKGVPQQDPTREQEWGIYPD